MVNEYVEKPGALWNSKQAPLDLADAFLLKIGPNIQKESEEKAPHFHKNQMEEFDPAQTGKEADPTNGDLKKGEKP